MGNKLFKKAFAFPDMNNDKKDYEDPTYVNHIFQGMKFVASQLTSKEYSKAYSQNKDEAVK